ncbi:MAG TPA: hypothetical protein ENG14_01915, partial [Thermodesulforhabdus norvegica]|nr:hypothetical protein [Thermodesulforhabdus norvegica]
MTNKEITAVAFKVFAIYVLVQTILSIPVFVQAVTSNYFNDNRIPFAAISIGMLACILLVVITVAIWRLSNSISSKSSSSLQDTTGPNLTEEFILSVVGLYLCFKGMQSFLFVSTSAYVQLYGEYDTKEMSPETIAYILGYSAQIII